MCSSSRFNYITSDNYYFPHIETVLLPLVSDEHASVMNSIESRNKIQSLVLPGKYIKFGEDINLLISIPRNCLRLPSPLITFTATQLSMYNILYN